MIENSLKHTCPCCGYIGLNSKPYEKEISLPVDPRLSIPYSLHFGNPSYDVCDCCGFEYGNDDEPGTAPGSTFYEYLKDWINEGCKWFRPKMKPENWTIDEQLEKANIPKPNSKNQG